MAAQVQDINALIDEAQSEVDGEFAKEAKEKIKASMRRVKNAEKVFRNAELEHEALLRDLRAGASTGPKAVD